MGEIYSKKEVGNRLRDIRCKLDLTQEQFAEILDISPQLYKKMESGENNISLNTLKKMKTKLNFSTDYLLFGEKEELAEIWNKTLALQIKLFCDISMNGNHMETKETAEKYNMIFQKIKEAMTDGDKDGKESPDIGRQ